MFVMMRSEFLSVLLLCCQVNGQSHGGGFNPFEVFQAFSGIGSSGSYERPNSLMNLLMNKDGKPQVSVSLGAPKIFPYAHKPQPTEQSSPSPSKSTLTSPESERKVKGTGFEDLELQPNWAEEVDESFSEDGSGEEVEKPKKTSEKPVEKKKSYIDLAKCFLKYGRENEKLGFCFGLNESATRPFYLASQSNEQLENNCRGSYDLNEFIKQRSVHKDLETNQLNCEPTLQHHQINVDFEEFERGSVQIIQQWRLVNSTKTETRNFRDETQRFTEIVKVNTEVYGF
uniref:Uncharacterized protein n=1 Tax=Bursaphelenchus xylophilus TaxID=6326 RepID=A0A1I7SH48_BURXY